MDRVKATAILKTMSNRLQDRFKYYYYAAVSKKSDEVIYISRNAEPKDVLRTIDELLDVLDNINSELIDETIANGGEIETKGIKLTVTSDYGRLSSNMEASQ